MEKVDALTPPLKKIWMTPVGAFRGNNPEEKKKRKWDLYREAKAELTKWACIILSSMGQEANMTSLQNFFIWEIDTRKPQTQTETGI